MKLSGLSLCIILAAGIFAAGLVGIARAEMPAPNVAGTYLYAPVGSPVISSDPASARPVGIGADPGHQLILTIGLDSFPGPVDVYFGFQAPAISSEIFLVAEDGSVSPLSAGIRPFRAGVKGPVSESIFGIIPMSALPTGDYFLYCLVTPAGSLTGGYHFWTTSVTNLRASDLASSAVGLFGGDAEAATAILMALAREYPLSDVSAAIRAGTLTQYGEITPALSGDINSQSKKTQAVTDICDDQNLTSCRAAMLALIMSWQTSLVDDGSEEGANLWSKYSVISFVFLDAADRGYSPSQIRSMTNSELLASLSGGSLAITEQCSGAEASGVCHEGRKTAVPDDEPSGIFSDVTPPPVNFNFQGISRLYYDVRISMAALPNGFTSQTEPNGKVHATTTSVGSAAVRNFDMDFWNYQSNPINDESFSDGGIFRDGAVAGGLLHDYYGQVIVLDWFTGATGVGGYTDILLEFSGLPFSRVSTSAGTPTVEYYAQGASVCNYIASVRVEQAALTKQGTVGQPNTYTDFQCDENSHFYLRFYAP